MNAKDHRDLTIISTLVFLAIALHMPVTTLIVILLLLAGLFGYIGFLRSLTGN